MEKFKSIAQALKKGYKITSVTYHQSINEWAIQCKLEENSHIKKTIFWRRKFPANLKWRDFESKKTKECGLFDMTLLLNLENQ